LLRGGQQAARQFHACGFRLGASDQPGVAVAVKPAICRDDQDRCPKAAPPRRAKRPEHGEDRRRGHHGEEEPQVMAVYIAAQAMPQ
jgi:hypothetical protein